MAQQTRKRSSRKPDQPGTAVAKARTTDEWLGGQAGVEIATIDGKRMISLPPDLEERTNSLVPFSQVVQLSANFSPIPRLVRITMDDVYEETKARGNKPAQFALKRTALTKLADIAGIELVDTDWSDMGGTGVRATVTARLRGPDGVWRPLRSTKTVRFAKMEERLTREAIKAMKAWKNTPEEGSDDWENYIAGRIENEYDHIDAKVQSKAFNRCVRGFLSVKPTYTKKELEKPFLVMTYAFTPNLADPGTRQLVAMEYSDGAEALYGGAAEPPFEEAPVQDIGGGEDDLETEAEELPVEDDGEDGEEPEPVEGEVVEGDPGPEEDEFDWGDETEPPPDKPEEHFAPKGGEYKNVDVEEILETVEGREWMVKAIPRIRREDRQQLGLDWMSWWAGEEVALEDLADLNLEAE